LVKILTYLKIEEKILLEEKKVLKVPKTKVFEIVKSINPQLIQNKGKSVNVSSVTKFNSF
jgi:hypothetical protein